jgi:hypothetical protein
VRKDHPLRAIRATVGEGTRLAYKQQGILESSAFDID